LAYVGVVDHPALCGDINTHYVETNLPQAIKTGNHSSLYLVLKLVKVQGWTNRGQLYGAVEERLVKRVEASGKHHHFAHSTVGIAAPRESNVTDTVHGR